MTKIITTKMAAKRLGMSERNFFRYFNFWNLEPAQKIGPAWLWTEADIERIKRHRKENKRVKETCLGE